jgi:hypothetical protein
VCSTPRGKVKVGEGGRRWEKVGEAVKDRYVCRR